LYFFKKTKNTFFSFYKQIQIFEEVYKYPPIRGTNKKKQKTHYMNSSTSSLDQQDQHRSQQQETFISALISTESTKTETVPSSSPSSQQYSIVVDEVDSYGNFVLRLQNIGIQGAIKYCRMNCVTYFSIQDLIRILTNVNFSTALHLFNNLKFTFPVDYEVLRKHIILVQFYGEMSKTRPVVDYDGVQILVRLMGNAVITNIIPPLMCCLDHIKHHGEKIRVLNRKEEHSADTSVQLQIMKQLQTNNTQVQALVDATMVQKQLISRLMIEHDEDRKNMNYMMLQMNKISQEWESWKLSRESVKLTLAGLLTKINSIHAQLATHGEKQCETHLLLSDIYSEVHRLKSTLDPSEDEFALSKLQNLVAMGMGYTPV